MVRNNQRQYSKWYYCKIFCDRGKSNYANEMMGFTEEEIRYLINETLEDDINHVEKERIVEEMRSCYNGYMFNHHGKVRVFNSNMSLNYLSEYFRTHRPPENLLDVSIASDYSKMSNLFALKNKSSN